MRFAADLTLKNEKLTEDTVIETSQNKYKRKKTQ